jgi:glycogen operon protein
MGCSGSNGRPTYCASIAGDGLDEVDARGRRVTDDDFILLFNAHHEPIPFTLPPFEGNGWLVLIDTARDDGLVPEGTFQGDGVYELQERSLVLLQKVSRQ